MSKSPAFQFYAADYLADEDVTLMSLEEEGAYIRALAYCWREGSIPADPTKLARLLKNCSNQTATNVQQRFTVSSTDPERMVHGRLNSEREKQTKWAEKSRNAGLASAEAKKNKQLGVEPKVNAGLKVVEPNANSSFASSSSSANKELKAKAQAPSFLPAWISAKTWGAYEEMRRRIRKPMTDRARELVIAKLGRFRDAGEDVEEVLNRSIANGWQDVWPMGGNASGTRNRAQERSDSNDAAAKRAIASILGSSSTGASGSAASGG